MKGCSASSNADYGQVRLPVCQSFKPGIKEPVIKLGGVFGREPAILFSSKLTRRTVNELA